MRWLSLYARSRRVPAALGAAAAGAGLAWSLVAGFGSGERVGPVVLTLTVLLLVAAVTATLGGPDDSLDRTAARPWSRLRASHLVAALGCVVVLIGAVRFGPFGFVVRDAAGLLGLTALGAVAVGPARSWFLPLGWTLGAATFPGTGTVGEVLTWQLAAPDSRPAATVAALLATAGLTTYATRGPRPRTSTENP
ncbi:hypothetical protein [Cryptosporangium sp. NPDC048952]|uniref:hypothetical protein n=1 Tax=Cryptosporangium sp. NPDC048952 TaxID=3363961 RepID=UPI003721D339